MGKAVAIVGVSAGGSAVAVGGNYMMGNFSFEDKSENFSPEIATPILPSTADDLKNEEDESCWKEYFPGFDFNDVEMDESSRNDKALDKYRKPANKLETSFFKATDNSTPRSCLTIN